MSLAKVVISLVFLVLSVFFLVTNQDSKAQTCALLAIAIAVVPVP